MGRKVADQRSSTGENDASCISNSNRAGQSIPGKINATVDTQFNFFVERFLRDSVQIVVSHAGAELFFSITCGQFDVQARCEGRPSAFVFFLVEIPFHRQIEIAESKSSAGKKRSNAVKNRNELIVETDFQAVDQSVAGFEIGRVLPQIRESALLQPVIFVIKFEVPMPFLSYADIICVERRLGRYRLGK